MPTIFALSTPPGRSAIAVVRVSGPQVGAILDAMAQPRGKPRFAALRKLRDAKSGDVLDEALVLYFAAPRTETGEDMAEFQLHGGKAIVRAVLDALAAFPECRPAEPGEFARRAFENGKLDLAQIEGLADLIDAETQGQRQQAMSQAAGVQSARFERWRAEVLRAMGLVEAAIDFSDEGDVSARAVEQAEIVAAGLAGELRAHLDDGHRGEILREGFRVVLAGPPNAGKSSLLNALARRDAAIVSEEAGTTRDVIDVRLDLEGVAVIVSDTAGIRKTSSNVEQEGIRRTLQAAREADLVVWLRAYSPPPYGEGLGAEVDQAAADQWQPLSSRRDPQSVHMTQADPHPRPLPAKGEGKSEITLLTKSDLLAGETIHVKHGLGEARHLSSPAQGEEKCRPTPSAEKSQFDFAISAKTGAGIDAVTAYIAKLAREATGNASDPAITRVRHRREIEAAVGHLQTFLAGKSQPLELRAEDLRLAGTALGRLTGRIDAEEVLGEIFSRFCIGK